jgi:signal transduction histidine kinase/CheY-like chemotaxis protein
MGALAVLVGAVVLVGWAADVPIYRSLSPVWVEMKPNTAIGLLLGGSAVMLTASRDPSSPQARVLRLCAGAVFAIGALTFCEYVSGWDLGIDQLLFEEAPGAIGTSSPGRMAFSATLCLMLVGAALYLRQLGRPVTIKWAQRLALAVLVMGALSLLGYVYNLPAFQGVISYAPMAVHTAAAFVFLGAGVLFSSPDAGFMAVISSPATGGLMARRLLPLVICLPPALGVLRLLGSRAGWYPDMFGISLKDGVLMVVLAAVVWISARSTNRFEQAQRELVSERWNALEKMQAAHDTLFETNRDLQAARAAADRANRAKSEFLSRMSHELRTPLNAILGFAQLMEMRELDAGQRESVQEINRGGRHLLALTNDVLDISRVETGRLSLSVEPVSVGEVLEESFSLIRSLAEARGIQVRAHRRDGSPEFVSADQQRLRQVLVNLLSNAVKYNRPEGSVDVTCETTAAGRARIVVADTGSGIDPELMGALFEPFARLGAERTSVEGTGLGLALSKRLVEAMGGALSADSVPGHGTRFVVELDRADSPVEREVVERLPDSTRPPSRGGCVLYIEDNRPNLRLLEMALADRPEIELITATTGEAGVELARARRPSLALVDINLPDIDGGEVLTRLRRDPATAAIPVVILSADATPRRIKELLAAGAQDYMTKPFDLSELFRAIDAALCDQGEPGPQDARRTVHATKGEKN